MSEAGQFMDLVVLTAQRCRCTKHGKLTGAATLDNRYFCLKCIADHLQRTIGEARHD